MRKKEEVVEEFSNLMNSSNWEPTDDTRVKIGKITRLREEYKRDHVQADSFCGECEAKPTIDCEFH